MKILALDLGTRTGWALMDGTRLEHGVQTFDVRRGESPGMRYIRFNAWLDAVGRVDLIVYEQPHQRGGAATEIALGFATRVHEFCALHPASEHTSIHSATLKKWATGKGNAKKPDMLAAVRAKGWARPGADVDDDNEADALALLYHALETLIGGNGR